MRIDKHEFFELQPDGSTILIRIDEVEVDELTAEELLQEKEKQLLDLFSEVMELRKKYE
jgi:hypothetical protein